MNIPVLVSPLTEHLHRIEESISIVNHLQIYFRLSMVKANWLPNDIDEEKEVDAAQIQKRLEKEFNREPVIAVIQNPFDDNWFSHESRYTSVITMADWESVFAPPPLKVYLAYQFAQALINFAADLSEEMIDEWTHKPPRGCLLDFFKEKQKIRLGMVGANLCGDCEVKFSGMGLPDQALESIEQILTYVRGATIRRPRMAPYHVFIGHGRSTVWVELKDYLTDELRLQVEEFNQEAVAGVATTERLQEMLNRACFAFLVMTAEDLHGDKRRHARENVIHEIGLFQGRLGFRKAIILKEASCPEFSNIHGLTYISFKKGRFSDSKAEIRRTLEREGLVEPATSHKLPAAKMSNKSRKPKA
jgi:Predicted nucleotide-binding protein containing TIR-like domain